MLCVSYIKNWQLVEQRHALTVRNIAHVGFCRQGECQTLHMSVLPRAVISDR